MCYNLLTMEENYEQGPENGKKMLWIIGGTVLTIMVIALVYNAVQHSLRATSDAIPPAVTMNTPASATSSDTAVLGASDRIATIPTITGMEVVNLQTLPYQVQAKITGTVPDSCSTFDTPSVTQSGKTFTVSLTASKPSGSTCTSVVTDQSIVTDIPVAGLNPGRYVVKIGKISRSFTLKPAADIAPEVTK